MQGRYIFLTPISTIQKSEAQETGKHALAMNALMIILPSKTQHRSRHHACLLYTNEFMRITGVIFGPVNPIGYVTEVPAGGQQGLKAPPGDFAQFNFLLVLPHLNNCVWTHLLWRWKYTLYMVHLTQYRWGCVLVMDYKICPACMSIQYH